MSAICNYCGEEISFRHFEGRIVPLGCKCRSERTLEKQSRDDCYRTTCPECQDSVFFIRHNGGCLWVDELGAPWDKHACFVERENGIAEIFGDLDLPCVGTVKDRATLDWKGRVVLEVSSTDYCGSLIILDSDNPTLKGGDIIALSEKSPLWPFGYSLMHASCEIEYKISTHVRECYECGELYLGSEYEEHRSECLKNPYKVCRKCNQSVHWTEFAKHRQEHLKKDAQD